MKIILPFIIATFSLFSRLPEKPFVIITPSYNNEKYCVANIRASLRQEYKNYRIIFINDCSSDRTLQLVQKEIEKSGKKEIVTIVDNHTRNLALANYYNAIHEFVDDDEIVLTVDGDDKLASNYVLYYLNRTYSNPEKEIWLTYGQLGFWSNPKCKSWVSDMPKKVVEKNAFRKHTHLPSHLRTFYAWLFKMIKEEDLKSNGAFYPMTWDVAIMMPMIEMARDHFKFIPKVLYIYNDLNPLNDHKASQELQFSINREIRNKPVYTPLLHRP
ncbi:MAG: glycosyltransferase [Candidatus Algichlamydia australiensis]|nr:glycosyltransferase [Chlamydiales bacterium]